MSAANLAQAQADVAPGAPQQNERHLGPKRLVVCMDGTWNNPALLKERSDTGDKVFKPTNVLKTCRAIKDVDDVTATLVLTGQPLDGETVTIDNKTYTFQDRLTDGNGNVQIGQKATESLENLRFAIQAKSGRKPRYSKETTRHPSVDARAVAGDRLSLELTARADATGGDPFATRATVTHGSWIDKAEIAAAYRGVGADPTLGIPQIAYYDVGVGGERKYPGFSNGVHRTIDKLFGGAAGAGFEANVEDAYTFLTLNYAPADEIYIFGFSRGASTARGLSNFIDWMGGILPARDAYWVPRYFDAFLRGKDFAATRKAIFDERLKRQLRKNKAEKAREQAEEIVGIVQPASVKFLGVWDTVLAISKKRARPHVGTSPAATVDHARQALAIDERRADFLPRIWERSSADNPRQTLEQRWFAGVHSNIGGGYVNDGLANEALGWMLKEARDVGLGLDWQFLANYLPGYPEDELYNSSKFFWKILQAVTFRTRKGIRKLETAESAGLTFHPSVFRRLAAVPDKPGGRPHPELVLYRPKNLLSFLARQPDLNAFLATIPGLPEDFKLPEDVEEAIRQAAR